MKRIKLCKYYLSKLLKIINKITILIIITNVEITKPIQLFTQNMFHIQYSWQHTLINAEHLKGSAFNAEVLLGGRKSWADDQFYYPHLYRCSAIE